MYFESDDQRPLENGGEELKVTKQNLQKYIYLKSKFYCFDSAKDEIAAIKKGINEIFKSDLLNLFSCSELNDLIAGKMTIDK